MGLQQTLKALADPIRREILNMLKKRRMSAGEITEHFSVTAPSISRHLSVLKDAASASIYGARAAFGVVLVKTKSGQSGKPRVTYSGNVRFSDATNIPEMLDSYTFAQYFNRAAANDNGGTVFSKEQLDAPETVLKYITA